ncbi:two-component sensor histidine kinase [Capnocytophaga sp. H4358]|uniref:sensor histidine kinase n=1 Tax=Capnocytophaga TaxID=1016 RepID=UPI000BB1C131|nr:ATP-binding protein [Capnocytophaga sp. H4358]ATA72829.1 two-component sensor histidine kinase [Capnocytophaga sp. H4358]
MLKKDSLRFRIFLSMTFLVVIAFAAIAVVMVFQYRKQAEEYHIERLIDKENQIKTQIQYVLSQTTYPVETAYVPLIFRESIYNIANILNVNFDLYDLNGSLLKSSRAVIDSKDTLIIPTPVLKQLASTLNKRLSEHHYLEDGRGYQNSYTYVTDLQFKPIAVLSIPHFEDDTFNEKALQGSLYNISLVYFSLLVLALGFAYFISSYITKSLKTIENRLEKTRLLERNEKIILKSPSTEIGQLVGAYNSMIDEIERSKVLLAKSEREQAWREMAKQVAHEIKNPLTPMRLSVQSFQRRFDPNDPEVRDKTNEFCESLVQQVDILSNISSAFSALTNMPAKQEEFFNAVPVVKRTLDIFDSKHISFITTDEHISLLFDKDQLVRVVTNLVKNAIQATENKENPRIVVSLSKKEFQVELTVSDNGVGIPTADQEKIFEPQFTTKTGGTGLGLAMVKSIITAANGSIKIQSQVGKGSTFIVHL